LSAKAENAKPLTTVATATRICRMAPNAQ
jgi:hypothetical protein